MKLRTPLDRIAIRDHLRYHGWLYLVVIAVSIFGWDLVYTTTAYRPPQDRRIDLYVQSDSLRYEEAENYFHQVADSAITDNELVTVAQLTGTTETNPFAAQQIVVYLGAREGDIYILSSGDFKRYAAQGAFLPLEHHVAAGTLNLHGLDASAGYLSVADAQGNVQSHLYGIPLQHMPRLMGKTGLTEQESLFLCVTVFNGNDENVLRFVSELLRDGMQLEEEWGEAQIP